MMHVGLPTWVGYVGLALMATGTCPFQLRFPESFDVAWNPPTIDVVQHWSPVYACYCVQQYPKMHSSTGPGERQHSQPLDSRSQLPRLGPLLYAFNSGSLDVRIRRYASRGRPSPALPRRDGRDHWYRRTCNLWVPPFSVWCTGDVNGPCTEPSLAGQAKDGARKQIRSGVCNDGVTRLAGL